MRSRNRKVGNSNMDGLKVKILFDLNLIWTLYQIKEEAFYEKENYFNAFSFNDDPEHGTDRMRQQ